MKHCLAIPGYIFPSATQMWLMYQNLQNQQFLQRKTLLGADIVSYS